MGDVALEGFGAGGAALNFKVVPGLTQPGTASENTIWVKTESLTGWYFAATQPENMQEGEVWFPTGAESAVEFNALKKNSLQVYPLSAKQMVDGVLVNVEAMSYQDGEWMKWFRYLYNNGNTYDDFTGGIKAYAYKAVSSGSSAVTPTLNNTNGVMTISGINTMRVGSVFVENAIDLSTFSTLEINVTSRTGGAGTINMGLTEVKQASYSWAAIKEIAGAGKTSLDVTGFTGKYYILIAIGGSGDGKALSFDSWRLT